MKRLRVFTIALALVLSLTAAIFAVSRLATKTIAKSAATSCTDASCCTGGACKMGGSCCGENASSCPMKNSEQKAAHQTSGIAAENGTKSCDRAQTQVAAETGKSCCGSGGACCKTKKMTAGL